VAIKMGVDQSYTSCAFVITNSDKVLIDVGIIKTDKTEDPFVRALHIANTLNELIDKYSVDEFNIEGLAFAMRGDATRDLAGLLFTIITTTMTKHPVVERLIVPPTTLKKFATGSGKADKKQMIEALPLDVRELFQSKGYKKTTGLTDVADAYWLSTYNKQ